MVWNGERGRGGGEVCSIFASPGRVSKQLRGSTCYRRLQHHLTKWHKKYELQFPMTGGAAVVVVVAAAAAAALALFSAGVATETFGRALCCSARLCLHIFAGRGVCLHTSVYVYMYMCVRVE